MSNVAKGIEEKTLKTLSEVIEEEIPQGNVAVLSGPSHAEEVGRGLPTTCVVSAHTQETAEYLQSIFYEPCVSCIYNTRYPWSGTWRSPEKCDRTGSGYCGWSWIWGQYQGGTDHQRNHRDRKTWQKKMGAQMETFYGLSGIGDLIVTCASKHSRNRKAGYLIGQGHTMEEAMDEVQMVVEGVYSARAARELAEKYEVEMPIITEVNRVLFEGKSAAEAVMDLMLRDKKVETPMLPWENI